MSAPQIRRSRRTESLEEKVALLHRAYKAHRWDLVESLADSIKDSVQYDRQTSVPTEATNPGPGNFIEVSDLPSAWAEWAAGWQYCKPLRLFETVGIERRREPVELLVGIHEDDITDPHREIRVARVESSARALVEIPSQVLSDGIQEHTRVCRIAFLADILS